MQRELKFRAYHLVDKKYVDIIGFDLEHADYVIRIEGTPAIVPMKVLNVQQSTGLKDKQGKEIYEGDYIKCTGGLWLNDYPKEGQIIFNKHCASFVMRGKNLCGVFMNMSLGFSDGTEIEVIGNIHENPELSQDVS